MTFRLRHLVAALILHILLFGLLAGGAQCSAKVVRPPPIQGVLLDASRKETALKRKEEVEKKKREEEAEKKRREEEKQAQQMKAAEELKLKQAVDARKRKEGAEKKKRDETAEKKKAEESSKKKKQAEEKEKQAAAQRELQDKARLEDEMRQEALRREADKEQSARELSERQKKQAEWADLLSRAVARKWTRPSTITQSFNCTVHVLLLPDGTVSTANVAKSCGNAPLDRSVEDAVYRASPLPKPSDPSIFDRDLIINFEPGNQ